MVENKITKNKYFYSTAVFAGTTIAAIVLFFVVINPSYNSAQELTSEAKVKQTELKKLQDKKTKLEALKSREDELKKDAETVRNALPEEKDVGRLFIELDRIAKNAGGSIKSVAEAIGPGSGSTGTEAAVGSSDTGMAKVSYVVPVEFKDYFGFRDFVTKTETALRLVGIDDFSINVAEGANSISASLNTSTYVRK